MKLGIIMPIWRRHRLASLVMHYHRQLELPDIDIIGVAVGSEGAVSEKIAKDAGWC